MNRREIRPVEARLWSGTAAPRTVILILVGSLIWLLGWYQTAGKATTDEQITPLNLAILGVVIAGAGQLSWILHGRRAVGRMRRKLIGDGRRVRPSLDGVAVACPSDALVAGTRFYHRPGCPMVEGHTAAVMSRADQVIAGRVACGVCRP